MSTGGGGGQSTWVVVPERPGPLLRVPASSSGPSEVDELLDEMLGEPDDRGAGPADALMLAAGAGSLVGWSVVGASWLGIAGGALVALGSILPVRSLVRRARSAKQTRSRRAVLKHGTELDLSSPEVIRLTTLHDRVRERAAGVDAAAGAALEAAAHAAVREVAVLLGGAAPSLAQHHEYLAARCQALEALLEAVGREGPLVPHIEAQARLQAQVEVDAIGGSSLEQLDELTERYRPSPGGATG